MSPHYASSYLARTDLQRFIRHAYHRGIVFLDGHGRPSSRFFPVAVCFYPTSAVWSLSAIRRKSLVPATLVGLSAAAAVRGPSPANAREVSSLAVATPVYALGHGAGMWPVSRSSLETGCVVGSKRRGDVLQPTLDRVGDDRPGRRRHPRVSTRSRGRTHEGIAERGRCRRHKAPRRTYGIDQSGNAPVLGVPQAAASLRSGPNPRGGTLR